MTQKLFEGMNPEQIITLCKSKRLNVENLIMRGEIPVLPLAQHFNIETQQPTGAIKYQVIDAIKAIVESPTRANKAFLDA